MRNKFNSNLYSMEGDKAQLTGISGNYKLGFNSLSQHFLMAD